MPTVVAAGGPEVRVERERREHHVSAVRAAHHGDAIGRHIRTVAQPAVHGGQVFRGVLTQGHVVQVRVAFAVSGGAAHVGRGHDVTPPHQKLHHGAEVGRGLGLGPAVNTDDDRRALPGPQVRRPIEQHGHLEAIETLHTLDRGVHQAGRVDAGAITGRQSRGPACRKVEAVDLVRRHGLRESEIQGAGIPREDEARHHTAGHLGPGQGLRRGGLRHVIQMDLAVAVDVGHQRQCPAVG
jgi:hypothetical protein